MADVLEPRIVHADEHLAVVDKPAGMIVHEAPGSDDPTLVAALGEMLAGGEDPTRPGIVHRLDRDTSGLLVVARTQEAHAALSRMIAAREVSREYLTLVEGCPPSRTGTIDAPLGRDHRAHERIVVGGRRPRPAVTHFEVRERLARDALLDVKLETGRTHQIRVHLQAIGHPVAGDPQYGGGGRYGLERQFLHSRRIAFDHPISRVRIEEESELPADLAAALELARAA
ncbi:MAG: RNA pseudouridine synthase [Solirubrobacterales bacterium]